jgi:phosphatidylserine/phosphatidylglycerophosphate/cardiolipin synthase-like enzyme
MRLRLQNDGITVNVIAGTYVVFFGLDLDENYKSEFRGFAIKRKDKIEDDTTWLRGLKTFKETAPFPATGQSFSTLKHPVQGFQWADYSVKPGYRYEYTVVCMYGDPAHLEARRKIEFTVSTEEVTGSMNSVFFNRGSVATQEYSRRFLNKPPNIAGTGAYEWLSRGLIEGLIAFIKRAKSGYSLHGAVYEFQYPKVLKALKDVSDRGASVNIIYDKVEKYDSKGNPLGPWKRNIEEIEKAKILSLCKGRSNAKLMHNKFLILSKGGKNLAVWSGSTNITENGLFGHSNLGFIIEDERVADSFMKYWERLSDDPKIDSKYRGENMSASPVPDSLGNGITVIFSPRGSKLDSLDWYAKIAGNAQDALFMTFAFGMHEKFKEVYLRQDNKLKMALMEKAFSSYKVKARDEADIQRIRNLSNVIIAIGNRIVTNSFDRWLKEMFSIDGKSKYVYWIHTKYMMVDPLGDEPVIISGSANFSKASTDTNDENMVVVKGDKRLTDIYFGEYMRLFSHYSFRESVKRAEEKKKENKPEKWKPQYLINDDTWMDDYYNSGDRTGRYLKRLYFSGPMSVV